MKTRLVLAAGVAIIVAISLAAVATAPTTVADAADPTTSVVEGDLPGAAAADASTTTTTPPPDGDVLYALIENPTLATAIDALLFIGESGDPAYVPYLIDLVRLFGDPDALALAKDTLAEITGVAPPDSDNEIYLVYGAWMYDNKPVPVPGYVPWKSELYALIDPAFAPLISQISDPVLASQIQWGGVRRGGIPELDSQPAINAVEATHMVDDELTFGVDVGGVVRSYPHRILDHHELANDVLGDIPVALANCTLCRTGILYDRRVGDETLYFQTSGLLLNSNKVMVDVNTDSLWNQLTGEAIAGPLSGATLDRLPLTVTMYGDWVTEHPDTDVLTIPDGTQYSYEPGAAYAGYYASDDLWFPVFSTPTVFAAKAEMATISVGDDHLAVHLDSLQASGPVVVTVGDVVMIAVPTEGGARFYEAPGAENLDGIAVRDLVAGATESSILGPDGDPWLRMTSGHSFWFAWYGNHPDTAWWPLDGA